jgi:hypothetical protein
LRALSTTMLLEHNRKSAFRGERGQAPAAALSAQPTRTIAAGALPLKPLRDTLTAQKRSARRLILKSRWRTQFYRDGLSPLGAPLELEDNKPVTIVCGATAIARAPLGVSFIDIRFLQVPSLRNLEMLRVESEA